MTTLASSTFTHFYQTGLKTFQLEIEALQSIAHRLNEQFTQACQLLLHTEGKIIVMGIGKSGHIANKIAATLSSTGSPSFFVHPAEAHHGDLGMITAKDALMILSNSGETSEILALLPALKQLAIPIISLTGNKNSTLALAAHINLDVGVEREACPLNLAPTSSTTAALVMGDAIAIALLQAKGFTSDAFAFSHPGGTLGRRLLLRVDDLMCAGDAVPCVFPFTSLRDTLIEMTRKRLGMTAVVDEHRKVVGVFTDGDIRRTLDKKLDIQTLTAADVMSSHPKTITPHLLAAEALHLLKQYKITSLLVTEEDRTLLGVIHLHALLERGMS